MCVHNKALHVTLILFIIIFIRGISFVILELVTDTCHVCSSQTLVQRMLRSKEIALREVVVPDRSHHSSLLLQIL